MDTPNVLRAPRVVIIDDHAWFRSVARELLQARGFEVVGEADGATHGMELVERVAPDAILLDVGLQDADGIDVCRALTETHPGLAVLLVSADDLRHRQDQIRDCGALAFLRKSRLASADLAGLLRGARRRRPAPGV
jgi:DNA-binding NarL/FixJ family response regulator